jgi:superfamily I DNA/RNA helicase
VEPGDDIATAVRQELAKDTTARRYRHIVIDEGQDLSPEALRSLAEAAQHGGSVTFFGDYHQAIYRQGLSWRSAGLNLAPQPGSSHVDNYRNTAAIAHLAIALSQTPAMASGDEDLVIPKVPVAAGPPPTLARARDVAHEAEVVLAQATEFAKDQSVAILARTWGLVETAARGLSFRKLDPRCTCRTPPLGSGSARTTPPRAWSSTP